MIEKIKKIKEIINYKKHDNWRYKKDKSYQMLSMWLKTKKTERDQNDKIANLIMLTILDRFQSDEKMNKVENPMIIDQVWSNVIHFGWIWWYISMIISSKI